MELFKARASASGKIMTCGRDKVSMGDTCKSYLKSWLKEHLYGKKTGFRGNKYTDKGLIMEDASLDFVAEQMKYGILIKNEQYYENDFIKGTPDIVLKDLIIDVKNSWSHETFPLFDEAIPNTDYFYQLQCYMELTGVHAAKLIYTLTDTPLHLIKKEAYWYSVENGYCERGETPPADIVAEFVKKMTYRGR